MVRQWRAVLYIYIYLFIYLCQQQVDRNNRGSAWQQQGNGGASSKKNSNIYLCIHLLMVRQWRAVVY